MANQTDINNLNNYGTLQQADMVNNNQNTTTDNSRHQSLNGDVTNSVVNFGDNAVINNQYGIPPEQFLALGCN